jgi:hypothetical protein
MAMQHILRIGVRAIPIVMWLVAASGPALAQGGAGVSSPAPGSADASSPPLTWDVVHRSAEILRTMERWHQYAIQAIKAPGGDEECGQAVYVAIEVIEWGASDKGMRSGLETPSSDYDNSGLQEIELTPVYKGIIRDEAKKLVQDLESRMAKRRAACPPPTGLNAEDIAKIRDLPLEPLTSRQKQGAPRAPDTTRATTVATPRPLIIVVTNPDGSIYFPGSGTCFKQSARKNGAGAGDVAKTDCPSGMPTDEVLRQGMFQKLGQTPMYGEPDWSDAKVTSGLLRSLQTGSEPVYLPYSYGPQSETPPVIWTQQDIQRVTRQMASTPPGTEQQRTGTGTSKSTGASTRGLSTQDIESIKNLPLERLPEGKKATARTTKTTKTVKQPAGNQAKGGPANEAASQIGQQLMQGLIQGGIQYGIGRAMGGGGNSGGGSSHQNSAPSVKKSNVQTAKPQGTAAKPSGGSTPSGGVMFYGVTGPGR